jgi:hypothetical protein
MGDALAEYHGADRRDVETWSFADAMNDPEYVNDMAYDARMTTHSAGMLAIETTGFYDLTAIAPPLKTSAHRLVGRAGMKAIRMDSMMGVSERSRRAAGVGLDQTVELLRHPIGNVRHIGRIAAFDSRIAGAKLSEAYGGVRIGYMEDDEFEYHPSKHADLIDSGVRTATLEGKHDRFLIDPQAVMSELDAKEKWHQRII